MQNKRLEQLVNQHKKITGEISRLEAKNKNDDGITKLLRDLDFVNKQKKLLEKYESV